MRVFIQNLHFCLQSFDANGNPVWNDEWTEDYYETTTTGLFLIDCGGVGWAPSTKVGATLQNYVVPAVQAARNAGFKILHVPSVAPPQNPTDVILPSLYDPSDSIFWDDQVSAVPDQGASVIVPWMQQHGVQDIFYVGFAANQCFLMRPAALMNMTNFVWGLSPLPRFVVLSDCTTGIERAGDSGDTLKNAFMTLASYGVQSPQQRSWTLDNASFLSALAG